MDGADTVLSDSMRSHDARRWRIRLSGRLDFPGAQVSQKRIDGFLPRLAHELESKDATCTEVTENRLIFEGPFAAHSWHLFGSIPLGEVAVEQKGSVVVGYSLYCSRAVVVVPVMATVGAVFIAVQSSSYFLAFVGPVLGGGALALELHLTTSRFRAWLLGECRRWLTAAASSKYPQEISDERPAVRNRNDQDPGRSNW